MAQWLEAVILGLLQGLTEFLPVSSSAHLRMAGAFLPSGEDTPNLSAALNKLCAANAFISTRVIFEIAVRCTNCRGG